jgi:hypothetical protein
MTYRLVGRNSSSGELIFDKKLDINELYSLRHTSDGNLAMLSSGAFTVVDYSGAVQAQESAFESEAVSFCHYEQDDCLVITRGEKINTLIAMVYDKNGDIIYSEEIAGIFRDCDCRNGSVAVLLDSSLIRYDEKGTERIDGLSARGVTSMADGTPVLVYSDRIERVYDN